MKINNVKSLFSKNNFLIVSKKNWILIILPILISLLAATNKYISTFDEYSVNALFFNSMISSGKSTYLNDLIPIEESQLLISRINLQEEFNDDISEKCMSMNFGKRQILFPVKGLSNIIEIKFESNNQDLARTCLKLLHNFIKNSQVESYKNNYNDIKSEIDKIQKQIFILENKNIIFNKNNDVFSWLITRDSLNTLYYELRILKNMEKAFINNQSYLVSPIRVTKVSNIKQFIKTFAPYIFFGLFISISLLIIKIYSHGARIEKDIDYC